MLRFLALLYGIACYLAFVAAGLYLVAFLGNVPGLPRTLDRGPDTAPAVAISINLGLLTLFGLQHSGMARQGFKRRWTRLVPEVVERSTYVLASSLALALLCGQWRPLPTELWSAHAVTVVLSLLAAGLGALLLLVASWQLDHFDLTGVRQVWCFARGRAYLPPALRQPWLYRRVRHPLMLGALLLLWAVPALTVGRLVFNLGFTAYILLGIQLEERDLLRDFGPAYAAYRRQVPMLWPTFRKEAT
ncbi:MAG: isoprenylcysteine carboxylmethyltransferase family protein [Planctomycetia bacterium]|nr:isoprenylcysteine carboxylmethyltransferase family protein [Planctomycetia bacterium]